MKKERPIEIVANTVTDAMERLHYFHQPSLKDRHLFSVKTFDSVMLSLEESEYSHNQLGREFYEEVSAW